MLKLIKKVRRDERGVSALEYAILAAVIVTAVVSAGTVLTTGTNSLSTMFTTIMSKVTTQLPK